MSAFSDRELLELAAKAAGYEPQGMEDGLMYLFGVQNGWNPLTDDGDALRLAVRLQLNIHNEHVQAGVAYCSTGDERVFAEEQGAVNGEAEVLPEDFAATRRAIVRAAAEIGRAMP